MQISIKGNGNLVRVSGVSNYPGLELTELYCSYYHDPLCAIITANVGNFTV